jgi:hypothetical protein
LGIQVQVFLNKPVNLAYKDLVAEMNAALAAATSNAEKETISANYTARIQALLDELYVGDPLDKTDSLELTETTSGYQFFHDGSESYFMNVTCIITDDQGNELNNLSNVKLYYGIGTSDRNRLYAEVNRNPNTGYYENQFEILAPGTYNFQRMEIDTGNGVSTITSAPSAPKIQAIAPTPISYVGKSPVNYSPSEDTISSNPNRWIGLVLRDAPSAEVLLTLRHTDKAPNEDAYKAIIPRDIVDSVTIINNGDGTYSYEWTYLASKTMDGNSTTDWFCYVDVPHDGTWQIIDAQIYSAFYKGVFYDGIPVEEGGTGYLDVDDMLGENRTMVDENITTDFFTTVKFSANKQPDTRYEVQFMTDNFNQELIITLTDYMGNALENVSVDLTYTWNQSTGNFTSGTLPTGMTTLGGTNLASSDGKNFSAGTLNFLLDGQYKCDFAVTINGTKYTNISNFVVPEDGGFRAENVTVSWVTPSATFTKVEPDGGITVNTGSAISPKKGSATNKIENNGAKCTANMACDIQSGWFGITYINGYTKAYATLQLSNAGNFTSGSILFDGSAIDATFSFAPTDLSKRIQIGDVNALNDRTTLGSTTASVVSLNYTYGGTTYTFELKLAKTLTLVQTY